MNKIIGYLGPEGTYSQQACQSYLEVLGCEQTHPSKALATIDQVVEWAATSPDNLALVPLENSLEGPVTQTLDLLANRNYSLKIRGELVVPVSQHLLVQPGIRLDQITEVLSHPQALAQCQQFLKTNLPGVVSMPTTSTAEAAALISHGGKGHPRAAIGNLHAATTYGLAVLESDIQDGENNCTRFIVLGHEYPPPTGRDKTSLVFTTSDSPGALHSVLGVLAEFGINLSKIESRPTRRRLGEYMFYLDLEGHVKDSMVAEAMNKLGSKTSWMKILGSYPVHGHTTGELDKQMGLGELRTEIDDIDGQLINLLAQRLQLVNKVGLYKLGNISTIRDKGREAKILDRVKKLAIEKQLDSRVIERIFKILFRYYSEEQAKLWPGKSTRVVK